MKGISVEVHVRPGALVRFTFRIGDRAPFAFELHASTARTVAACIVQRCEQSEALHACGLRATQPGGQS